MKFHFDLGSVIAWALGTIVFSVSTAFLVLAGAEPVPAGFLSFFLGIVAVAIFTVSVDERSAKK